MRFSLALTIPLMAGLFFGLFWYFSVSPANKELAVIDTSHEAVKRDTDNTSIEKHSHYLQTHKYVDAPASQNGLLVMDYRLRFYFEFFLLQRDRLTSEQLLAQFRVDVEQRYSPRDASYLLGLFQRFIQYLDAVASLDEDDELTMLMAEKQNLQAEMFSMQEQQALFTFSDMPDVAGSAEQQKQLESYYKAIKETSADAYEGLRVAHFGMEAAARFRQLDEQREQWSNRLQAYQCQRQQIEEAAGIAPVDKAQQLQALQQRLFDITEQRRLQALQRNGLLPAC